MRSHRLAYLLVRTALPPPATNRSISGVSSASKHRPRLSTASVLFRQTRSFYGAAKRSSVRDCYEVLNLDENASQSDIKNAYFALAKNLHPDRNKDVDAEEKFRELQHAYETLKDQVKHKLYNRLGPEAFRRHETGCASHETAWTFRETSWPDWTVEDDPDSSSQESTDPFYAGFRYPRGGQDNKVTLDISFVEAVQGCTKTVTFKTDVHCGTCGGTGFPLGSRHDACRPRSDIKKNYCKSCKGQKVVRGTKSVKLHVMPGADDSETIKVYRSGGADPSGNRPGHLYVTIKVQKDLVYRREKYDIHVNAALSSSQAVMGGTTRVPTPSGDIEIQVNQGTKSGDKVVLRGKGIKRRNVEEYGDLYVHFKVNNPVDELAQILDPLFAE